MPRLTEKTNWGITELARPFLAMRLFRQPAQASHEGPCQHQADAQKGALVVNILGNLLDAEVVSVV